jgi:hypothetical protein
VDSQVCAHCSFEVLHGIQVHELFVASSFVDCNCNVVSLVRQRDNSVQACLDLDYEGGLEIRDAPWPTLRVGLSTEPPLPWDLLFALALIDARDGCGDPLWNANAEVLLPAQENLPPLPCLQTPAELHELQDPHFAAAAVRQVEGLQTLQDRVNKKARLLGAGGAEVTLEEVLWGYACVRSRAFVLSESRFVQVRVFVLHHGAHVEATNRKLLAF